MEGNLRRELEAIRTCVASGNSGQSEVVET
jgi:hypothetical protein